MTSISDKQRDILRHALGVGRGRTAGWRNHFCTGPGSDDYSDCEALVAAGLVTATDIGRRVASMIRKRPSLSVIAEVRREEWMGVQA